MARDGGSSMLSVKITECRSDLTCPKYQTAQAAPKELQVESPCALNTGFKAQPYYLAAEIMGTALSLLADLQNGVTLPSWDCCGT